MCKKMYLIFYWQSPQKEYLAWFQNIAIIFVLIFDLHKFAISSVFHEKTEYRSKAWAEYKLKDFT